MNITDYAREPGKLAELIGDLLHDVNHDERTQVKDLTVFALRDAMRDLQGIGHAAEKRKAELAADAKREGLFPAHVVVRDLTFADVHTYVDHWNCPDMTAEGEQALTVYYASLDDDEGPYIKVKHVSPVMPLILKGEGRDLVIGAGSDIYDDLISDRLDEIADKVREAIRMAKCEQLVDMAEAA